MREPPVFSTSGPQSLPLWSRLPGAQGDVLLQRLGQEVQAFRLGDTGGAHAARRAAEAQRAPLLAEAAEPEPEPNPRGTLRTAVLSGPSRKKSREKRKKRTSLVGSGAPRPSVDSPPGGHQRPHDDGRSRRVGHEVVRSKRVTLGPTRGGQWTPLNS